jgi:hypothetical protein
MVLALLRLQFSAHFANNAEQFLVLGLWRGDAAEEHEVVSDHFIDIIGWRSALISLQFFI